MNYTDPKGMKPVASFYDEIIVFDSAPMGFEIPIWVLKNVIVDASGHFDQSRFDFSQSAFPAWEGWNSQGCDFWCKVFTEVGRNSDAANFLEFGVSSIFVTQILGPLLSPTVKEPVKRALNPALGKARVGSALKNDAVKAVRDAKGNIVKEFPATAKAHGFPDIVDNFADGAVQFELRGGAKLYQLDGSLNGVAGRFEWIVDNGQVTHRMFVSGGTMNGVPIVP